MLFRKNKKLRKNNDEKLLILLETLRTDWIKNNKLIEHSIEPTEELLYQVRLAETRYFYLIREAKIRKVSAYKLK